MTKTALLPTLALLLLAGCGQKAPPPAPKPVEQPKPPAPVAAPAKPGKAPPLTDAQNAALKKDFEAARALVREASKFKTEGDAILKAQGAAAANDTYVKSKELYQKAVGTVSDWIDGDLAGKVTDAQVKDYLGEYTAEVGRWQSVLASMGKLAKD